jgi:hypothetical protein
MDRVATLRIEPEYPNPQPGESIMLHVLGFDSSGAPMNVDGRVFRQASHGTIDANGFYRADDRDAVITARIDSTEKHILVRVGNHVLPIDVFRHDGPAARAWRFASAPAGLAGGAEIDSDDVLALSYDFSGNERAAYANADITLEGTLLSLSIDVQGDASGAALRAIFTNADGDRIPVTLARHIDWQGQRTLNVPLPPAAIPAQSLNGFYLAAVSKIGDTALTSTSGTIALRNLSGTFAGSSTPTPPYHVTRGL